MHVRAICTTKIVGLLNNCAAEDATYAANDNTATEGAAKAVHDSNATRKLDD